MESGTPSRNTWQAMAEENVEIVQRLIDYVNETGEAGPLEMYDAEVTFTTRGDVGGPETFTGHRGMADAGGQDSVRSGRAPARTSSN
jgi:hypothetical protein